AWEEAGLGHAEQKAEHIETLLRTDEHHGGRDQPPREHDPRDPDAGPDPPHDEVARHLEAKISDEENSRAEGIDIPVELQVVLHLQLSETDVHPVEIRHDIQEKHER